MNKKFYFLIASLLLFSLSTFGYYLNEDVYHHVKSGNYRFKIVAKYGQYDEAKLMPLSGYMPQNGYKNCIYQYDECEVGDTISINVSDAVTPAQYRSMWVGGVLFYFGLVAGFIFLVLFGMYCADPY